MIDDEVAEAIRKRVLCAPAPALAPAPVPADSTMQGQPDDPDTQGVDDAEEDDEDD